MAPLLQKVINNTGETWCLYINGKEIVLDVGVGYVSVNEHIDTDIYTKFETNSGDADGYMLKYDDFNIYLNDALGKSNEIVDEPLRTWRSEEYVSIDINQDAMKIWCTSCDLGIYSPDGFLKYYKSVIAKHNEDRNGGIIVTGVKADVGEPMDHVEMKEDVDEGGSSKD
ncbi:hypothetical protein CARUB_v10010992mg [Capsella rubella]|uniref:Uncharacterized protein n=1 Tax=Capsella rubella TaxID=81985 RepID=R0IE12_9BRAS|nr:uncharacterized protein LOC17899729 [Capsella rubella]EOA36440.1 hypothetical protein CARUB_v10010992mg [Capsella rubella]